MTNHRSQVTWYLLQTCYYIVPTATWQYSCAGNVVVQVLYNSSGCTELNGVYYPGDSFCWGIQEPGVGSGGLIIYNDPNCENPEYSE